MRQPGTWLVASGPWFSSAKWRKPLIFAVCWSQWTKAGSLGVDGVGRASEADIDDDEGHVRDSEVAFGTFPQTELDVSAVVEIIVDTGTDRVSSRLRHRRRS